MNGLEAAARAYARWGWPVLPVRPGQKAPLTAHGVKDASTDPDQIGRWWRRWGVANVGIACGAPGPTVLDVDDPLIARYVLARLADSSAPAVATARGCHVYFAGESVATIQTGAGELRGRGSYVLAPPSLHPSGKLYVWLVEPATDLEPVPKRFRAHLGTGAGAGVLEPVELVPYSARHPYLKDLAVRFTRAGILDTGDLAAFLELAFERHCEPLPRPAPGSITALARWAAGSDIARRERAGEVRFRGAG